MKVENNNQIKYPWSDFLKEKHSFNLFGYGSLINQYSSQLALKYSTELIPVTGFGIKRVLNYDPDEMVRSRPIYHDPERGDEYFGVFNIEYTGRVGDKANGVLRRVEKSDFENFVSREVGYSLVKIDCTQFGVLQENRMEAYTLVAPQIFKGRQLINNQLLPNVPYYKLCREGAQSVSNEFLEMWLETSFLGDGRNVREWEMTENIYPNTN